MHKLTACLLAGAALSITVLPSAALAQSATVGAKMAEERGAQGAAARDAAGRPRRRRL
jgi:hypothetical protein